MEYKAPPAPLSVKPVDYMTTGKAMQEGVQGIGTGIQKGLEAVSSAFSQRDFKLYQKKVKQDLMSAFSNPDGTTDFKELIPDAYMKPDQVIEGLKNIEIMGFLYNKVKAVNPNANTGSMGALASMAYYGTKDDVKKLLDSLIAQLPEEEKKIAEDARQKAFGDAVAKMTPDNRPEENLATLATSENIPSSTREAAALKYPDYQNKELERQMKENIAELKNQYQKELLRIKWSALKNDKDRNAVNKLVAETNATVNVLGKATTIQDQAAEWHMEAGKYHTESTKVRQGVGDQYVRMTDAGREALAQAYESMAMIASAKGLDSQAKVGLVNEIGANLANVIEQKLPNAADKKTSDSDAIIPPINPFILNQKK